MGGACAFGALSALLGAAGCAPDKRITIQEFIESQRAAEQLPPTTQPVADVAAAWQKHGFVPYRIGPSDELTITLIGLKETTDQVIVPARVNREGQITLPMTGPVKVGDLEIEDAERVIHQAYVPSRVKNLSVHVQVSAFDTTDVLVVGAVTTPGITPLRRTERDLLHAVANAKGFSAEASGRVTLKRVRRTDEVLTLDLLEPKDLAAIWSLPPLESGDLLTVEADSPNTIFVGGLVNSPGPKSFPAGTEINLLQALAASGGPREDVAPSEATLVRRMNDGRDVQVKLNLDRLRKGQDPNILLAGGDILWIPETAGTKVLDFVNRNIYLRAGVSMNIDPVQIEQNRLIQNRQAPLYKVSKRQALIHPFGGSDTINPLTIPNNTVPSTIPPTSTR